MGSQQGTQNHGRIGGTLNVCPVVCPSGGVALSHESLERLPCKWEYSRRPQGDVSPGSRECFRISSVYEEQPSPLSEPGDESSLRLIGTDQPEREIAPSTANGLSHFYTLPGLILELTHYRVAPFGFSGIPPGTTPRRREA